MTMKHPLLLAIFCPLLASSACNTGKLDDDGGGTDGTTTDGEPVGCGYGSDVLFHGEEVDSPDGCVTFVCDNGSLATVEDRRVTVAGDLELSTQDEVDQQACLGVVEGTLVVSGTAADLTPLSSLYRVGGSLQIVASEAVTLSGLEGLGEVGGSITIADNASLTTLAFQSTMSAFGDVTIENNDALASLAGAEFLGQCGSCVGVAGRPAELADSIDAQSAEAGDGGLDEPGGGGTFFGSILIVDNDVLTDVLAMSNLWYAWADVRFRNNAALTSLRDLQLTQVRGTLEVSEHASMSTADADAFAAGIDVWGETVVCGNLDGVACP